MEAGPPDPPGPGYADPPDPPLGGPVRTHWQTVWPDKRGATSLRYKCTGQPLEGVAMRLWFTIYAYSKKTVEEKYVQYYGHI